MKILNHCKKCGMFYKNDHPVLECQLYIIYKNAEKVEELMRRWINS